VAARPDRLVWGADWPHTKPAGERPQTKALAELFLRWTPAAWRDRIASGAARELYRFPL
jgi:2-pyrone-4,6-dicarboxylate lactonase